MELGSKNFDALCILKIHDVNLQYILDEKQLKVVGPNQVSFQSNIGSSLSLLQNL